MRDEALQLITKGEYEKAIRILREVVRAHPNDWNACYLAGVASRFLGNFDTAITWYLKAESCAPEESLPRVWQNLGVVYQLKGDLRKAVGCLKQVLKAEPYNANASNSLAITLERMGDSEEALHQYERAMESFSRSKFLSLKNSRNSPLIPYRDVDGEVWCEHVLQAAIWGAAQDGVRGDVEIPTFELYEEEERTRRHGGLFYVDTDSDGERNRLYLPNYIHTMSDLFWKDQLWAMLMHNVGRLYHNNGDLELAEKFYRESVDFIPLGSRYDDPLVGLRELRKAR